MSRVAIRSKPLGRFMNFNFWVELDGVFIANEIELTEAERIAHKIADALGEPEIDRLDFYNEQA